MIAFIKQATSPCFKLPLDKELKNITDSEYLKIINGTFENITDVIESIAFYGENHLSERSKNPLQRLWTLCIKYLTDKTNLKYQY